MSSPPEQVPAVQAALVSLTAGGKVSIPFQYNPDSLQRTIEPNLVGGRPGARSRATRFAGAPAETLTLECRLAAPDGDGLGIAPQLAALTLLAYPSTTAVQAAQAQLDAGVVQVNGLMADPLLLVFGSRAIPVQLTGVTIVEQLHDTALTPVVATVTISLRAVSYSDVDETNPSFGMFLAYQQQLETLSQSAKATTQS